MDNIFSERQAEIHDTLPFFLQHHESKIFELNNLLSVLKSSALIYSYTHKHTLTNSKGKACKEGS